MVQTVVLDCFAGMLAVGMALGVPIVAILTAGFFLFAGYALSQGNSLKSIVRMSYSDIRSVRDVVILYLIVGMLCAAWRAAGTIPYAVSLCAKFMSPSIFILMSFLACCLMSTLMGTSTGTAATMGVICITLASTLGADKVLAGGAILAGCFFGDRCSPMSGSAILVANLTKTKVNHNVGRMARTAAVPFILSCLAYAVLGTTVNTSAVAPDVSGMFATTFHLSWLVTRSRNRCPVLPEGNG